VTQEQSGYRVPHTDLAYWQSPSSLESFHLPTIVALSTRAIFAPTEKLGFGDSLERGAIWDYNAEILVGKDGVCSRGL